MRTDTMHDDTIPPRRRHRGAAFALVALTPLISELALGSTPMRMAWLVLLWMPIYGAGVLLIREAIVRRGRGWPSLLLLAAGYELLEDGIGLQALTSPHLYGAAGWGLRLLGLNLPYWEANLVYHAVFTVLIPIALSDLLFPAHAGRPYLGRPGMIVNGIVALLGVGILRTVGLGQDPGYQALLPVVVGCLLAVVVLAILALVVVPPMTSGTSTRRVPPPAALFLGGGIATLVFFGLTFPVFGARQPAFTVGATVLIPMLAAAGLVVAAVLLLGRWGRSARWTSRHTLWLIGGALAGHSVGGLVIMAHTTVDRIGLVAIVVLTLVVVRLLDRRMRRPAGLTRPRTASVAAAPPARPGSRPS